MRVKILSSTSTFNGVSYNTKKTQNQKGELMKLVNFGYLNHSDNVAPSELKALLSPIPTVLIGLLLFSLLNSNRW